MFGYYTPILILQAICLYHAYKNNTQQMWFWLIIFFPVVGCLLYLYNNFASRRNIKTLAEGVKGVVNSNYRIEQLEKELRFSDTVNNKVNLADAYVGVHRYEEAVQLYSSCLQGFMADDPTLRMKLLHTHYQNNDYEAAINYGLALEQEKTFKNAEERALYALALYHTGRTEDAEKVFEELDKSFTNYPQRLEYARFLFAINKTEQCKEKLAEMLAEFEHMDSMEKRLKRDTIREVRYLYNEMGNKK